MEKRGMPERAPLCTVTCFLFLGLRRGLRIVRSRRRCGGTQRAQLRGLILRRAHVTVDNILFHPVDNHLYGLSAVFSVNPDWLVKVDPLLWQFCFVPHSW